MPTHIFRTMGTMASLVFEAEIPGANVLDAVHAVFEEDDARFSLYRTSSELSRLNAGELTLASGSAELRDAYALAAEWRLRTRGAFTPERPGGTLDLSGVVKALSIERARAVLEQHGISDAIVDVGGDAVAIGCHGGASWLAGIVDPADRSALLCAVPLDPQGPAIATSGIAERGEHVWRAGPSPYAQVTVLAADIVTADVLATAILAGGEASRRDATERWAIDVLTVDREGALELTPGLREKIRGVAASAR